MTRIHTLNESRFARVDSEDAAYWLGFIAADGCVTDQGDFAIQLARQDECHLHDLRDWFGSTHAISRKELPYPSSSFTFRSRIIADNLARYGVTPRKSITLNWPSELNPTLYRHYIRGYVDGGGGLYSGKARSNQSTFHFSVIATKTFADKLQSVLMSECRLKKTKLGKSKAGMVIVEYGGFLQVKRIFHYLYDGATVYLLRKRFPIQLALSMHVRPSSQPTDEQYQRCATLPHDEICQLYIDGDSTVDLSRKYNVSIGAITSIVRKHGLLRSTKEGTRLYWVRKGSEILPEEIKSELDVL